MLENAEIPTFSSVWERAVSAHADEMFGFASRLAHILHRQRNEQAVIEEVLAESEADLKARG